jgi:hypothetical protein
MFALELIAAVIASVVFAARGERAGVTLCARR